MQKVESNPLFLLSDRVKATKKQFSFLRDLFLKNVAFS